MQRVMIIGPGGAGKTTLARRIGERTGLPVVHLDRAYWQPGWVEPEKAAFDAVHDELTAGERWIVDGNYGRTMSRRAERADTIVLLDPPPWRNVLSAACRAIRSRGTARPDMNPGCVERINGDFVFNFLRWIWRYRVDSLPGVLERIEPLRATKTVQHFRSRRDAYRWLDGVAA